MLQFTIFSEALKQSFAMKILRNSAILLLLAFALTCQKNPSVRRDLPESTPEAEGVSSSAIITFLDSLAATRNEFHGFVFLRHGKVIAKGWWDPYKPEYRHTLYSTSKSFTSTAVGFAVAEKKLSVNDTVINFFKEDLPDTVSGFLKELRVKDLLTMSAGMDPDPSAVIPGRDSNWVKGFLATPIVNEPGSKFLYNSMATYMLSAIVQKVTGQKVMDYLTPRLFEPLGIENMDWEEDLRGINTGGWGLRLHTMDMAKFGQLLLKNGAWNGMQVIPSAWVHEATTFKIDQAPDEPQSRKDSSDWKQGYCYQFWRCRHNAFRADGAFGQFIIVMPDQDAVIAINSETSNMQDELNLVWKYLLPAMGKDQLPADSVNQKALSEKLKQLKVIIPVKTAPRPDIASIDEKSFALAANPAGFENMRFAFDSTGCRVSITLKGKIYDLLFSDDRWSSGETTKPAPNLVERAKENRSMLVPAKYAGHCDWKDGNTLELLLKYVESPHSEKWNCRFTGKKVDVTYERSMDNGKNIVQINGEVQK
jgi:CubicO group peptidase (beta-lactamase class C family)